MQNNSLYIARLCSLKNNKKKKKWSCIANYILSNLESVDNFTIEILAENTDTSYATVCRFFKEIGVSGIKEFKRIILHEMQNNKKIELKIENYSIENLTELSFRNISSKVCDFSASVVTNCFNSLKEVLIEKIINYFNKADFIYFVGLGTSAVTASITPKNIPASIKSIFMHIVFLVTFQKSSDFIRKSKFLSPTHSLPKIPRRYL